MTVAQIFKSYKLHLTIILLWIIVYSFNQVILSPLMYKSHISFVFIPAGIRIVFATLYRSQAFLGLFFGACITGYFFLEPALQPYLVFFSLLSALTPIFAVVTVNHFFPMGDQLQNLDLKIVFGIAALYGLYCAFFHNLFTWYLFHHSFYEFFSDVLAMFIGDMSGSLIFLFILASQRHRILDFFYDE